MPFRKRHKRHVPGVPRGFPSGPDGKECAGEAGDLGSILGLGRSPGEGNGYPLQYSCKENSVDRGAWQATVHGVEKSWTRWVINTFTFQGFPTPGAWISAGLGNWATQQEVGVGEPVKLHLLLSMTCITAELSLHLTPRSTEKLCSVKLVPGAKQFVARQYIPHPSRTLVPLFTYVYLRWGEGTIKGEGGSMLWRTVYCMDFLNDYFLTQHLFI